MGSCLRDKSERLSRVLGGSFFEVIARYICELSGESNYFVVIIEVI